MTAGFTGYATCSEYVHERVMPIVICLPAGFEYITAAAFGLIVGSFLTVVVHRLPIMLERAWQRELRALGSPLAVAPTETALPREPYNLCVPRSSCTACGRPLKLWEIAPLVGFVLLRARCRSCHAPIDPAYPLIECSAAALAMLLVYRYGFDARAACGFFLAAMLLALGLIDATTGLLPNVLTLPLLWGGLLVNATHMFVSASDALIGAAAGYVLLRIVSHLFMRIAGRPGFAPGDYKLLGALGAWLGWHALPQLVLIATASGVAMAAAGWLTGTLPRARALAFGPFLVIAALFCLLSPAPILR